MYAELSLYKLKIYTEELEYCEKKLRKSLYGLSEQLQIAKRPYNNLPDEVLWKMHKQYEELAWTIRYVKELNIELYNIIGLYDKCETRLSKKWAILNSIGKKTGDEKRWQI